MCSKKRKTRLKLAYWLAYVVASLSSVTLHIVLLHCLHVVLPLCGSIVGCTVYCSCLVRGISRIWHAWNLWPNCGMCAKCKPFNLAFLQLRLISWDFHLLASSQKLFGGFVLESGSLGKYIVWRFFFNVLY